MKIHHKLSHGESIAIESSECIFCGSEFTYYPSEKSGKYCIECVEDPDVTWGGASQTGKENGMWGVVGEDHPSWNGGKDERECLYCGDGFLRYPSKIGDLNFCSVSCNNEWRSENVVGENHPQYTGYTGKYGHGWWRARRKARKRDSHTCQNCGLTDEELGQEPDVHHIIPVRKFDDAEEAHFLDNLICLCRTCHRNVEEGNTDLPKDISTLQIMG